MVRHLLLDTPLVSAWVAGRSRTMTIVGPWLDADEATSSVVVYGEAAEHYLGQPNTARHLSELRELMRQLKPIRPTYADMIRYAELRRRMRRPYGSGTIGDVDTLIAATALERDLTVVTTDRDFARVPDLKTIVLLPAGLKGRGS